MSNRTPAPAPLFPILLVLLCAATTAGCRSMTGRTANRTGTSFYRGGQIAQAQTEFARAVIDEPGNANHWHNLAAASQKLGDHAKAEQAYRQALYIDPAHQPSYHGLASLLTAQSRHAEAMNLLTAWTATQPYNAGAHIEMASLQRQFGDTAAAERSLQQALKVQPNNPIALSNLGQLYEQTGQTRQAVAMYQRSLYTRWNQKEVRQRLAALQPRVPGRTAAMTPRSNMMQPHVASQQTTVSGWSAGYRTAWQPSPGMAMTAASPYPVQYVQVPVMAPGQPAVAYAPLTPQPATAAAPARSAAAPAPSRPVTPGWNPTGQAPAAANPAAPAQTAPAQPRTVNADPAHIQ